MIWLTFAASSGLLVAAAIRLASAGDVVALRTGLGRMFVGTMFLALATSLPELLTMISALDQGSESLAAGSIFGSCMFNMALLAILDIAHRDAQVLRRVALTHAVGASLATLIIAASVLFIQVDLDLAVGWVGVDSLILVAVYIGGVRLIRSGTASTTLRAAMHREAAPTEESMAGIPTLRRALLEFAGAVVVLVLVTPAMVASAVDIAAVLGVSEGFVGAAMVAVVTSLPEAVTTFAAARIGSFDIAVGNLFGSNLFNVFALGLIDVLYVRGRFLGAVDPVMTTAGMFALVLTALGLVGNVARMERRVVGIEIDALLILVVYGLGMWLLYSRGLVA